VKISKKPQWNGIEFDSKEEREFFWWSEEAQRAGFIKRYDYHPEALNLFERASKPYRKELKTKSKIVDRFLLHPHDYTPDFVIYAYPRFRSLNHGLIAMDNETFYIDVKGGFSIYNNEREFSINQKAVYHFYGIYVNKVIPKEFFRKTFCPARAARTGTGQPRKHYSHMPTVRHALAQFSELSPPIEWVEPSELPEPAPDLFKPKPEFSFDFGGETPPSI
jgi:hypothetical protein